MDAEEFKAIARRVNVHQDYMIVFRKAVAEQGHGSETAKNYQTYIQLNADALREEFGLEIDDCCEPFVLTGG
jgi:hypothetical protein